MTKPLNQLLDEVRALAEKATPGPWFSVGQPWLPHDTEPYVIDKSPDPHAGTIICDFVTADIAGVDGEPEEDGWRGRNNANAAYIAALDPTTIKRIVDAAEALEISHALVQKQAEDDGLWFIAQTAAEAYLQQELRKLHHSIEMNYRYSLGEK